jgi:hypothetical protein
MILNKINHLVWSASSGPHYEKTALISDLRKGTPLWLEICRMINIYLFDNITKIVSPQKILISLRLFSTQLLNFPICDVLLLEASGTYFT